MTQWKKLVWIGVATSLATLALLVLVSSLHSNVPGESGLRSWDANSVHASFAGVKVKEIDTADAVVTFYYDLENRSDHDYQLESGPAVRLMTRVAADGSLQAENRAHLAETAFVPVGNRTRIGIQVTRPFAWTAQGEGSQDNRVRDLVAQETIGIQGFVLFDSVSRYQIELTGGWR